MESPRDIPWISSLIGLFYPVGGLFAGVDWAKCQFWDCCWEWRMHAINSMLKLQYHQKTRDLFIFKALNFNEWSVTTCYMGNLFPWSIYRQSQDMHKRQQQAQDGPRLWGWYSSQFGSLKKMSVVSKNTILMFILVIWSIPTLKYDFDECLFLMTWERPTIFETFPFTTNSQKHRGRKLMTKWNLVLGWGRRSPSLSLFKSWCASKKMRCVNLTGSESKKIWWLQQLLPHFFFKASDLSIQNWIF